MCFILYRSHKSIINLHLHPVFRLMCCEWRGVFHLSHIVWPWKRSQHLQSIRIIMRIINSRDYKKNARIIVLECMYIVQYKCIINNSGEQHMRPRKFQMHVCYLIWTRLLLGVRHTSLSHTSPRKQLPVWKDAWQMYFWRETVVPISPFFRLAKITTNLFLVDLLLTNWWRNDRFC